MNDDSYSYSRGSNPLGGNSFAFTTPYDLEELSRGRPGADMRFRSPGMSNDGVYSTSSQHPFPSSAGPINGGGGTSSIPFSSGSPFSAHSRDGSMGGNGPFVTGTSPHLDSYTSPRLSGAIAQQRAIGFEVGRANGNGSASRTSSLGPVARPQLQAAQANGISRTVSAMGTSASHGGGFGPSLGYSANAASAGTAPLGSLAINDEDLLGDLESLNLGAHGSGPSVLARVQHDAAQIQQHPSVRVPSNYAAQTGVHAASVPSGFGLGQLWGSNNSGVASSSGLGGNGSIYGSSAGSNSSSTYGAQGVPAHMSASTSSHLFNRNDQNISPHLAHHSVVGSSAAAAAAAEYLHGSSPYGGSHGHLGQHHHTSSASQQLYSPHHSHAHSAHPLSASWNDSGAVTPGTSAPPASGARMHELAERLHRHQQVQQAHQKHKHGMTPSRDLGGASWGTSGSPTALGGLGSSISAAAALGRSPASTSGLGRRAAPRSGSQASISRRSLDGRSGSDFDAQSSHSESDWVDDDGPDDGGADAGNAYGNGSLQHHHHHHRHHHLEQQFHAPHQGNGHGVLRQHQQGPQDEYEEGEEGTGGAGSRTPTARTSRHPLGAFTSLSGISAAAAAAQQQQQQHGRGRTQAPSSAGNGAPGSRSSSLAPPIHSSLSQPSDAGPIPSVHALAPHGLSELAIASLAALGGGAGGSGGFGGTGGGDMYGSFGGQYGGPGQQQQQSQHHQHHTSISSSGSFGMLSGGFGGLASPQQQQQQQQHGPTSFQGPGVAELGKGVPLQTLAKDTPLYIVEFKQGRKELYFVPEHQHQAPMDRERIVNGDLVIVEADRGKDLGTVVYDSLNVEQVQAFLVHQSELLQAQAHANPAEASGATGEMPMYARLTRSIHPKRLYGKASANDTGLLLTKAQDEERALQLCRTKVSQRGLPMTVVAAEMQWDRRKLTFYYTASARVDFRDLVKELFRLYKTRIWMCHLAR
ncbi:hypothetical protein OC844_000764 [Tilletia horrida]|nr:hypothetical protein OC844_000764 [Tilletia horrida]